MYALESIINILKITNFTIKIRHDFLIYIDVFDNAYNIIIIKIIKEDKSKGSNKLLFLSLNRSKIARKTRKEHERRNKERAEETEREGDDDEKLRNTRASWRRRRARRLLSSAGVPAGQAFTREERRLYGLLSLPSFSAGFYW